MIPQAIVEAVEESLTSHFGAPQRLKDARRVGGGCISDVARIETESGERAFLKWQTPGDAGAGMFFCEADGLRQIAAVKAVRVPDVIACCDNDNEDNHWLLLEWLEPGAVTRSGWEVLGRNLAQLHREQFASFGWPVQNFIGSLEQWNDFEESWPVFFREQRLRPQLRRAADELDDANVKRIERLLEDIDEMAAVGDEEGASLLHGDLWGGNVHGLSSGEAAVVDPSVYYGHREVDLAMARLFGGFDERFFAAYNEAWPLSPGHEKRSMLYQLYYLLVHVNLFGGSYVRGTMSLVAQLGF